MDLILWRTAEKGSALVTGASSGIGLELARQLAANGYSLVIVARDRDRLEAAATRLRSEYGVSVENHAKDLSEPGAAEALWADLAKAGVTVDVLVNNAGVGAYGEFQGSRRKPGPARRSFTAWFRRRPRRPSPGRDTAP